MPERVRVNVKAFANTKAVRHEKRNGRDVMIVPSATLPDDIIMNGIKYPADEIEASYASLNRTPAPYGHPMIGDLFVSARDPEGINIGYIGAWNENAERRDGRVFVDKVIDVEVANRTEKGKAVIDAINKGEPVHTSTGLWCDLDEVGDDKCRFVARNIEFDHDAILLDEEGAATPAQGVGMMVNSGGGSTEVTVYNSRLQDAERELEWAAEWAAQAVEKMERAPMIERIATAIKEAITGSTRTTPANEGDADMADGKQLNDLSAKVNAIEESLGNIAETITNAVTDAVKPIKDHVDQIEANQKAADEAKRTEAVNKLVKSGAWTEDELSDMPLSAINKLVEKAAPGKAAAISNGATPGKTDDDEFDGYTLNAAIDGEKKEMH